MRHNYSTVRMLSSQEKNFVIEMAKHGDATKAIHESFPGMSDQAARVLANQLMKRKDIQQHIRYLKQRFEEIDFYVAQI